MRRPAWLSKAFPKQAKKQTAAEAEQAEQTAKFRSFGWAAYLEEDYESAEKNLHLACQGDPINNLLLGHVHFSSGKYNEARACYLAAIEAMKKTDPDADLRKDLPHYHCWLGNSYSKLKLIDEALHELKNAQEALEALSRSDTNANRPAPASDRKAALLDQLAAAYVDLYFSNLQATPDQKAKALKEASEVSAQALCLKPNDAERLHNLGVVRYYQAHDKAAAKNNDAAESFLAQAEARFRCALVDKDKDKDKDAKRNRRARFYSDLAFTYAFLAGISTGDDVPTLQQRALKTFQKAIKWASRKGADTAEYHNQRGLIYLATQDQTEQAIEEFIEAIAEGKDKVDPQWHANLGASYLRQKQYDEAIANYQKALNIARQAYADTATYYNLLGLAYDNKGDLEKAILQYKEAIHESKQANPDFYWNLGNVYYQLKQYGDSAREWGVLVKLQPTNADYWNWLGNTYYANKDYDKAIQAYQEAIHESEQANPDFHWNLGNAYYQLKQYGDSAREWDALVKLQPKNARYWNWLGNAYYANKAYDKAIQAYREAVEYAPGEAVYRRNLGSAYIDNQQPADAIMAYQQAIERDPENWNNHYLLGLAYRRSNEFDKARVEYQSALQHSPEKKSTVQIRRSLGFLYQEHKHFDEAITELEWVRDESPEDIDVRISLGIAYAGKVRPQEALAELRAAKKLNPEDARVPQAYSEVGNQFYPKSYSDAAAAYKQAVQLAPENGDYANKLGNSLYGAGAYQKAIEAYRKASELQPEDDVLHANLADALKQQADYLTAPNARNTLYREAANEYRRASEIKPDDASYHYRLALCEQQVERWEQAITELERATKLQPQNLPYRRNLAGCLSAQGKYQEALQVLALPTDADVPAEYLLDLANAYAALDRYADAVNVAERINLAGGPDKPLYDQLLLALQQLASSPELPQGHTALALANDKLRNYTIAIGEYRKAIALSPDNWELHKYLGNTLYKNKNLREAAAEWAKVVEQNPNDSLTINNLGTAYDGLDRFEESIVQYQRAADLNPSNFVPFYNIGTGNYRLGRIEEARLAFEQAKKNKEDFAPTYYNLGNCYYRLGNSDRATVEWQEATRLNPNFSEVLFNLGVTLWKSGQREEAKQNWQAALRSDANFAVAEDNLEAEERGAEPDLEIRDLIRSR